MTTITYFGHNCFLLKAGISILTDPFISGNDQASFIDIDSIRCDYMLLTHGHLDHVLDVERILGNNPDATLVGMVEVIGWFRKKGITRTIEFNFGGTISLPGSIQIKMVPATHTSSLPDGSYGGHPASYIIKMENEFWFMAGDTALHSDMKLWGELYDFDLLFLPIGGHYTMDYRDAALAAQFLRCNHIIGCHYNTFPPISIDSDQVITHFQSLKLNLQLPAIGSETQRT